MAIVLVPVLNTLSVVLQLYSYALMAYVVLNLLITFRVVNPYQPLVQMVYGFLYKISMPLLGRLQRVIPPIGQVDLSPLAAILLIHLVQNMLFRLTLAL